MSLMQGGNFVLANCQANETTLNTYELLFSLRLQMKRDKKCQAMLLVHWQHFQKLLKKF